jgi:nitronate monooxygenase
MHTAVCDTLNITHPVVLAGMGGATNPELVAAVSNAGGLGILGVTWSRTEDVQRSIARIRGLTDRPFGVNFVLHLTEDATFQACLDARIPVFSFFRGDPAPFTARAQATGARVLHQVITVPEAQAALAAGVDVLVALRCEAGGHMGPLPLWTLLPEVVAVAGPVPVLAAGGIVDGQGLAAALGFGASGVLMGTRFIATPEAPSLAAIKEAIVASGLGDTVVTMVWDILWDVAWPGGIRVRSLHNAMVDRWHGNEAGLQSRIDVVRAEFNAA